MATAGVSAGLCFVSKQDVGLYALAAFLLTVTFGSTEIGWSWKRLVLAVLFILAAFFLTCAVVLLPIWFSGGGQKFVDYGFINKIAYLRFGRVSYLDGLTRLVMLLGTAGSIHHLKQIYWQVQFLLPPLTFAALLAAWFRAGTDERPRATVLLLFVGAAFLGVFPRADSPHLTYVIPEVLLGLTYAWHRIKPLMAAHWMRLLQAGLLLWLGMGLGSLLVTPFVRIASGKYRISALPHFRGPLIPVHQHTEIRTYANTLKGMAGREQPFLVSPYAGLYYLVTGLKNPTPFDYPFITAFGRDGEAEVIAAISRRKIRSLCLDSRVGSPLSPVLLERYVLRHMERSGDLGLCTLYRTRP